MYNNLRQGKGQWRGSFAWAPEILIYPHARPAALDVSASVTMVTTSKSMDSPEGNFSFELKANIYQSDAQNNVFPEVPEVRDLEALQAGDWVSIAFANSQRVWTSMVGVIDEIEPSRGAGAQGAVKRVWRISGRDFGRIFTVGEFITLPGGMNDPRLLLGAAKTALGVLAYLQDTGPGQVIEVLTSWLLGRASKVVPNAGFETMPNILKLPQSLPTTTADGKPAPAGGPFGNWLNTNHIDLWLPGIAVPNTLMETGNVGETTYYSMLKKWSNDGLNELFFDLRPPEPWRHEEGAEVGSNVFDVVPCVVLRERPFPVSEGLLDHRDPAHRPGHRWANLPWTEIDERDLMTDTAAKSDSERFNYFLFSSALSSGIDSRYVFANEGQDPWLGMPAISQESVQLHGFRRIQVDSPYLPPAVSTKQVPDANGKVDTMVSTVTRWTHILRDWYGLNHEMLSGTLTLNQIHPGIRIGERINLQREEGAVNFTFYTESISHEWRQGGKGSQSSSTTIRVTRGYKGHPNNPPTAPAGPEDVLKPLSAQAVQS